MSVVESPLPSVLSTTATRHATRVPVTFVNRDGLTLFGVLHEPVRPSTDVAALLLSPGVKMRVGPERLYLRLADLFAELGIPALRFDCNGLGDSEGVLTEPLLRDVYGNIEVGRFVGDTIDAMDWMQHRNGHRRFVLSGLCGGAITGLLAGARDNRVAGLLALGITPLIASRSVDPVKYMTSGQLKAVGRTYMDKLVRPHAWLRFLTLKTDYRLLYRAVRHTLVGAPPKAAPPPATGDAEADNASPLFPPAFFQMLSSNRPMLLVFGGSDRLGWEFEEKFVKRYPERLAASAGGFDVHTIAQANHVLSFGPWQDEMMHVAREWLSRHFGAASAVAARP